MDPQTGRCAILFPHGVLFRKEEAEMRQKLVEADLVECVLGLGPNLFYNSPMEACIVICQGRKIPERQGKVLFIDALDEIARERSMSFLKPEHQKRIADAYHAYAEEPAFAHVADLDEIAAQDYSLSIPLYVKRNGGVREEQGEYEAQSLKQLWQAWEQDGRQFWQEMDELIIVLNEIGRSD
jgi:type I restriction enzyme M protein